VNTFLPAVCGAACTLRTTDRTNTSIIMCLVSAINQRTALKQEAHPKILAVADLSTPKELLKPSLKMHNSRFKVRITSCATSNNAKSRSLNLISTEKPRAAKSVDSASALCPPNISPERKEFGLASHRNFLTMNAC